MRKRVKCCKCKKAFGPWIEETVLKKHRMGGLCGKCMDKLDQINRKPFDESRNT